MGRRILLLLGIAALTSLLVLALQPENVTATHDQLVRFHVIANSDTEADQQLKRDVRDEILKRFGGLLSEAISVEQVQSLILNNLSEIESVAQQEVRRQGYSYSVEALLGEFDFPVKSYGSITLPAGRYQALRVVIGEGSGENWWCILFPPLCFVDISNSLAKDVSQDVLPAFTGGKNQKNIKVRFKVLELLKGNGQHRLSRKEVKTK
ncbi:stage II sporulation protein R [Metallumcola ferriviriculae]|uniref:Stage II sporulation protein R n=1 Tax=Metallumcola ferriviriculae TaxID=3039180 RepID=A0AAU0UP94_9FIRM|nr:stage II sporulation protein R [Desulfitibacteraceae bacterium MK1]